MLVVRFIKYVSSSAVSSRWDATAEYQVSSDDIDKDDTEVAAGASKSKEHATAEYQVPINVIIIDKDRRQHRACDRSGRRSFKVKVGMKRCSF